MSNTPPFKEAWAHDFAPPIHSLDRHGDFAPPLLALGLAAGFFGVATDDNGGGLQYHLAQVYGPHNIGDWLDVKTTDIQPSLSTEHFFAISQLYTADVDSYQFVWVASSPVTLKSAEWSFAASGFLGYLDGGSDILYTQGGTILRYSAGADISFFTTDGAFPGAGDFNVSTSGSSDNLVGNINLNAQYGDFTGQINLSAGTGTDQILVANSQVFSQASAITNRILAGGEFAVDRPTTGPLPVPTILLIESDTGDVTFRFVDVGAAFVIEDETGGAHGARLFVVNNGSVTIPDGQEMLFQDSSLNTNVKINNGEIKVYKTGTSDTTALFSSTTGDNSFKNEDGNNLAYFSADGSITMDLKDTKTFVINDHLGSPLVTYTG